MQYLDNEHPNYDKMLVSNNFEFDKRKLKGFEGKDYFYFEEFGSDIEFINPQKVFKSALMISIERFSCNSKRYSKRKEKCCWSDR